MTLEQQVVSLELAKRLKELGVKQESLFWWRAVGTNYKDWGLMYNSPGPLELKPCAAFTVAELYQLHYEKFGTPDFFVEVDPTALADYIATEIINQMNDERDDC